MTAPVENGSLLSGTLAHIGGDLLLAPERLLIVLGLGFFVGLAFEEFFSRSRLKPPGGVRTFPLLALTGALLYALAPETGALLLLGLGVLGLWLAIFYWQRLETQRAEPDLEPAPGARIDGGIMAPLCNLIVFLLGPITLSQPLWIAVSIAVTLVLLTGARERLHAFAADVGRAELTTLGKFLIIIGIILPLVPDEQVTHLTPITPYEVWLAVVAVSTLSYASYLLQRYIAPKAGAMYSAALGGLYSSTATTVVLSRQLSHETPPQAGAQAGIVLSTSIMFLRILAVVAIFNLPLATTLMPALLVLCAGGLALTAVLFLRGRARSPQAKAAAYQASNPLEVSAALTFAVLFVALSLAVAWGRQEFGESGIFGVAAIAGVTDVDPFVLSLAQSTGTTSPLMLTAAAILVAAASNNFLKAGYTLVFAGRKNGLLPAGALFLLAFGTVAAAAILAGIGL